MAAPEVVGVAARGRTGRCNSGVRSVVGDGTVGAFGCAVVGDGTVGAFGCAVTFGALAISSSLLEYSLCDLLYIWKVCSYLYLKTST